MTAVERQPWERQPDEAARPHAAFRLFRDLGPTRTVGAVVEPVGIALRTAEKWARAHDWHERAEAWDDECHRLEDVERLEAIRTMHANHRRAGRAAMLKALQALERLPPEHIPAGAAARLLELGARLERQTLTVSIEELQGVDDDDQAPEDPWERIARALDA